MTAADPGRTAYEARFAHARPRDVEPWDSLPPEVRAIWARVECASQAQEHAGFSGCGVRMVCGSSSDIDLVKRWCEQAERELEALKVSMRDERAAAASALATAEQEAARWGSEYADAMDARMADAITMERVGSALAVFARMNAMDPPEGVRLNDWLPAVTAARAALKEAGLQRLMDPASGTSESKARSRA